MSVGGKEVKKLYVGNLPFSVQSGELKELFGQAGPVVKAEVAMNSGFSKGFGTVVFTTAQDAQAAIDMFNGFDLKGRFIDVREDRIPEKEAVIAGDAVAAAALRPLAELGPITSKALYIGNVPYSVGWQDLKDLCRQYGNVVRADIPQDYNHRSKGFGTVVMSTLEESKLVATKLHGFEWNGRRLDVREDRKYTDVGAAVAAATAAHNSNAASTRSASPSANYNRAAPASRSPARGGVDAAAASVAGRQLYVGNLPFNVQWQELKDMFRHVGNVVRAEVQVDNVGRSRGFGQVTMATVEEAVAAIAQLNGTELQGREIEVREDRFAAESSGSGRVFVGNLPFSTRWQELKDLFKGFNFNPTHADIMLENGTTRSKGCGTVRFASVEEAEKAIAQVNGAEFGGRNLIVRFDKFS